MARRKKINRRLRARSAESLAIVPVATINDRVKLAPGVPGWGGRRGLVVDAWGAHGATHLKVRLDKTDWTIVSVLASEVTREDCLGREAEPLDTGSIWDVMRSPFAAPNANTRWA